jgi:hypothetical protein
VVHPRNGILFSHERKEILTHAAMWMNLEDMLIEIRQTQKDKYYMYALMGA